MSDIGTVVVITQAGARIIKGVHTKSWEGCENAVINPDLSGIAGYPPHLWRIHQGQLAVVPAEEQEKRQEQVDSNPHHMAVLDSMAAQISEKEKRVQSLNKNVENLLPFVGELSQKKEEIKLLEDSVLSHQIQIEQIQSLKDAIESNLKQEKSKTDILSLDLIRSKEMISERDLEIMTLAKEITLLSPFVEELAQKEQEMRDVKRILSETKNDADAWKAQMAGMKEKMASQEAQFHQMSEFTEKLKQDYDALSHERDLLKSGKENLVNLARRVKFFCAGLAVLCALLSGLLLLR